MTVEKMTDEERRARRMSVAEAAAKIQAEYGEALAVLGHRAVVASIPSYTVEEHVAFAATRGITLDVNALRVQREYLDLLANATWNELDVVTAVLSHLLDYTRTRRSEEPLALINEIISIMSFTETMNSMKKRDRDEVE